MIAFNSGTSAIYSSWHYSTVTGAMHFDKNFFALLGRSATEQDLTDNTNNYTLWQGLLHPEDTPVVKAAIEAHIKNADGREYEQVYRLQHQNGDWLWIWSRGRLISNGKMAGSIIDITSFKNEIEENRVESTLLRTLIDSLPDVIYVKDSQGRKIIANPADVASLGLTCEKDVIGKTDVDLFAGDIGVRGYEDDMAIIETGNAILDKEEFFFDAEGKQQWLLTTKVPVQNVQGITSHILGIGHNITGRKQYEDSLEKLNQELSEQSVALSNQAADLKALNERLTEQKEQETEKAIAQGKFEIASEILHDIGNALVGFGAYLNRINRVLEKGNLSAVKNLSLFVNAQQTVLATALGTDKANALCSLTDGIAKTQADNNIELSSSVNELLNITAHIQEILNIQRQFVVRHEGNHERKPVNIINIINDCRAMLLASLEKKDIKLQTNITPGNYITKGDHTKLMQVILNILKNSVEAIDLDTHDKKIHVNVTADPDKIQLKIKDNGKGFDPITGENLFKRGFTTKSNGTGLGLYNCRSIIESHAGQFNIKSDGVGFGAEITIVLPLHDNSQ